MTRKSSIILLLFIGLLAVSCGKVIDINVPDSSRKIVLNSLIDPIDYDLFNPNNLSLVVVLFIILIFSGIASIKGSCLWFKNRNKAGFYILLTSSIVGIASMTTTLCLFKDKQIIHVFLLFTLLVTLVENILLRMKCSKSKEGINNE